MNTEDKLRAVLEQRFRPRHLEITDDSARHAGHPEAVKSGGGHFSVVIVSEEFAGRTPMQRHRMVYRALGEIMGTAVHALAIRARTPEEWSREE